MPRLTWGRFSRYTRRARSLREQRLEWWLSHRQPKPTTWWSRARRALRLITRSTK